MAGTGKPLINYGIFTDSTNNKIVFRESATGSWLTATLTTACNPTTGEYAQNAEDALNFAGAETYTVSFARATRKLTVASSGAYLSILWNTAASARVIMGYGTATDTGAASYAADTAPASNVRFTHGVQDYKPGSQSSVGMAESHSGKREHIRRFGAEFYAVDWSQVDTSEKDDYEAFSTGWACKGLAFDYYPSGTAATFYRLQLEDPFREITFNKISGLDLWGWSDEFRFEK